MSETSTDACYITVPTNPWPTTTNPWPADTNTTYIHQWTYPDFARDANAERIKEIRGWLKGFLAAKKGALTKSDVERIVKELERL